MLGKHVFKVGERPGHAAAATNAQRLVRLSGPRRAAQSNERLLGRLDDEGPLDLRGGLDTIVPCCEGGVCVDTPRVFIFHRFEYLRAWSAYPFLEPAEEVIEPSVVERHCA
eukprot:scaffold77172_cov26-Tisochrysis_lutea.AAC.3